MESDHIITEQGFINILLQDKEMAKKWAASGVGVKRFDKAHEMILKGIMWALNEDVKLTTTSFTTFVEGFAKSPAEVVAQRTVYQRCNLQLTKQEDFPMLLAKVNDSYVKRKTAEFFNNFNKQKEKIGYLEANNILVQNLTSLENETKISKTTYIDLGEQKDWFIKDREECKRNPKKRLLTDIAEIDHTMGVGAIAGGLTIFCAPPGTYKTTLMMNIALNIYKNSNENVCYLPLEGPYEMFLQKIVSRETRIPFDKIDKPEKLEDGEWKNIQEQFEKWQSLGNRFRIIKPGDRAKVSTIKYEIEKRIDYYQPRVLFVDYLDNVVPERFNGRNDLDLRDIFEDLIRIGEDTKCHIFTAAKLGREAIKRLRDAKENNKELDTTDVHGGQEFGGNATNLFGQVRNPAAPSTKLDFFCMKSRFGQQTFGNGKMKSSLMIQPDIGYISSEQDVPPVNSADELRDILGGEPTAKQEEQDDPFA